MTTPKELLAASLEVLHRTKRVGVVRSSEISRTHRERLKRNGFLEEVIRPSDPLIASRYVLINVSG